MMAHSLVYRLLVIDSVPYESVNYPVNLSQKARHLRRILFVSISDLRSQDPTILIHTKVQFLPTFAPPFPMLLGVPFSLATDLQTRTVHDKVHRAGRQAFGASGLSANSIYSLIKRLLEGCGFKESDIKIFLKD